MNNFFLQVSDCHHNIQRRLLMRVLPVVVLLVVSVLNGHSQKAVYLDEIKRSAEKGWRENAAVVEQWKRTT